MEFKSAEESLGISSEEYHKIVNDCIFGDNGENADMGIKEKAHQIAWEASNLITDARMKSRGIVSVSVVSVDIAEGETECEEFLADAGK